MIDEHVQNVRNNPEKAQCFFSKILAFTLDPIELKEIGDKQNIKIIDVRKHADFEIGHIPQAISIPFEELSEKINELNKDDLHIIYCYNIYCHLGAKAAYLLAQNGFSVMELCGGFKAWAEDFRFSVSN